MTYHFGNAFTELMRIRKGKEVDPREVRVLEDPFPLYRSPIKIAEVITEALAARAVAANDLWELKTGSRQQVMIDEEVAGALCALGTPMTQRREADGHYHPIENSPALADMIAVTQPWECRDGRWFLPHFNLPNLERRVLGVLKCEKTPAAVAAAVKQWPAAALDREIAAVKACGGIVYSPEEWLATDQGKYLAQRPVVEIERIGDSAPEPLPSDEGGPLAGIKLLDLTRIIAGPTCGEALTEHGAKDLMITASHLPQVPAFVRDSSSGKRSAFLDYTKPAEREQLTALAREADIFLEGYRPGALARHGFSSADLARLRPGIIYVSVNCHGSGGPYGQRAGWDQVAQANTGIAYLQGKAFGTGPQLVPVFMSDFLTGYLGAFGAMVALRLRATVGGSYKVAVSLDQSCMLALRQGLREDDFRHAPTAISPTKFAQYAREEEGTSYGDLKILGPAIRMSATPLSWANPTPALGSSPARWW